MVLEGNPCTWINGYIDMNLDSRTMYENWVNIGNI